MVIYYVSLQAEVKNIETLRKDKGYLIHVGGLCPSVSEVCQDLFSEFLLKIY